MNYVPSFRRNVQLFFKKKRVISNSDTTIRTIMKARKFALTIRIDDVETIIGILKALGMQFAGKIPEDAFTLAIRGSALNGELEESKFKGGPNAISRNLTDANGDKETTERGVLAMREALNSPIPEPP